MKTYTLVILAACLLLCCCTHRSEKALTLYEEGKQLEKNGLPDSALITYRKAAELLADTENDSLQGIIYNQMGNLMFSNVLRVDAFEFYQKALAFNLKMKDKTEASRSLRGMGKSNLFKGASDSAIVYLNKALLLSSQIANRDEVALIHNNLSVSYFELQQFDSSLFHNTKSLGLVQDSILFYKNYFVRGNLFKQFGQYDSALICYNIGLRSMEIYTQAGGYYSLTDLARLRNSGDSAKYLKTYHILKDSIERANKSANILNRDRVYQIETTRRNEQTKYSYWIVLFLAVGVIVSFFFIKRHRTERQKNSRLNKKVEMLYKEMTAIKDELSTVKSKRSVAEEQALGSQLQQVQQNIESEVLKIGSRLATHYNKTDICKEIKNILKSNQSVLSNKESKRLNDSVAKVFSPFVLYLVTFFGLSADDCFLCCLSLCGFTTKECAFCRGVSNEAIRVQKSRIKTKMYAAFPTTDIFRQIFLS